MKKQPKRVLLSQVDQEILTTLRGGNDPTTPPPPPPGTAGGYFGSGH